MTPSSTASILAGAALELADFRFEGASGADLGRLEVTTTTRRKRSSFIREVGRRSWRFRSLSWSWTMQVRDCARIDELHAKIEPLLAQLERDGLTDGWIPDQPGLEPADPGALPPALARLGVLAVCAARHHAPGETSLGLGPPPDPGSAELKVFRGTLTADPQVSGSKIARDLVTA